jgi:lipid II:glycine glycyltransferase (peptidoglycan interpeptide bridge formation enzyme)
MPAYDPEFRNLQSTSYLIWESMLKSIDLNKKYFNFGGTWPNQENLFRFKRGWNADNFYYNYFIKCDIERLKNIKIEDFPKIFQDFYVCPYNLLKK